MSDRKPRFRNITTMGFIAIIFAVIIGVQGAILLVISNQNLDLKNFFVVFNQSVVENRAKNANDTAFREIQLQNIEDSQDRNEQFMPLFLRSVNDTRLLVDSAMPILDVANTTFELMLTNQKNLLGNQSEIRGIIANLNDSL